jgi:glycine/D-amino acid oxidase-like deaminating enzyme
VECFEAQVWRLARRLPDLAVPLRPTGLAGVYDVTPDWLPIYDRSSLDGFYLAIGTSGNQFKNAPLVGQMMLDLVDACEAGHDHDADPVTTDCHHIGRTLDLGTFSRLRTGVVTSGTVLG